MSTRLICLDKDSIEKLSTKNRINRANGLMKLLNDMLSKQLTDKGKKQKFTKLKTHLIQSDLNYMTKNDIEELKKHGFINENNEIIN